MADGYIQLPADSTGKKVDSEELTVGANTVERERIQVTGTGATQIAPVSATAGLKVDLGADNDVTVTSGTVTVGAALPAGTNNIGDVDVITLPALPAGSNNIGDVDIASALPAGTNNIGDVDVLSVPADPFGANADAASATGSISAKLRFIAATGIPVTALPALAAGTNAIGKLSANSGVDIGDVDVASLPALVTGAAKIGVVSEDIIAPCNGATALTPKFVIVDCASSGDNVILAAVSGKKIRVLAVVLVASGGANTCTWKDGSTAKSGGMGFAANGGYSIMCPYGLWEGTANTALNLNLSAATSVDGHITYVEV